MEMITFDVLYPEGARSSNTLHVQHRTEKTRDAIADCLDWGTTLAPKPERSYPYPKIFNLHTIERALQHCMGREDVSSLFHIGYEQQAIALKPEAVDALMKNDWATIENDTVTITISLKNLDEEIAWGIETIKYDLQRYAKNHPEWDLDANAKVHYLNNITLRMSKEYRAANDAHSLPDETHAQWYERNGFSKNFSKSEKYMNQTSAQFFAEFDAAFDEAGMSVDAFPWATQESKGGPHDEGYAKNIDIVMKAYRILRQRGYTHSDVTG